MNEEIQLLQKKAAKVDRLLKTAKADKKQFYESKREKYISELGELAHLDAYYLYNTTDADIRDMQKKISQLDKQLSITPAPSSVTRKSKGNVAEGRHKRYMQQLENRDKYIQQLGELVYKDDHYGTTDDLNGSTTDLGASFASLGFASSSKLGLGDSFAAFNQSLNFNQSFSGIPEEQGDGPDLQLSPESTIVIQKDESIYNVIDKLVTGAKPENSHIVNIVFGHQQYILDDIVMGALEKIMLNTIREQGRKWRVLQMNSSYEVPKNDKSQNTTCQLHQQKVKDKITRLIHNLHRNLRDEKLFNKFNDLDRHEDDNSKPGKNQMGEHVIFVTATCTLVFKKNVA